MCNANDIGVNNGEFKNKIGIEIEAKPALFTFSHSHLPNDPILLMTWTGKDLLRKLFSPSSEN